MQKDCGGPCIGAHVAFRRRFGDVREAQDPRAPPDHAGGARPAGVRRRRLGCPGLCRSPAAFLVKNKDSALKKNVQYPQKTVPSIINSQIKFFVCEFKLFFQPLRMPFAGMCCKRVGSGRFFDPLQ